MFYISLYRENMKKNNGNEAKYTKQANILPILHTLDPMCGSKVKTFFLKVVLLHIKLKEKMQSKLFDLMHTPWPLGLGKKVCRADKYILIELSMLRLKHWLYYIIDML